MYIIYYSNDGLFCLNCLNDFFCIFILKIKDLKKRISLRLKTISLLIVLYINCSSLNHRFLLLLQ